MKNNSLENISVILVQPKKAGNIGLIARLCNNFGVDRLVLVGMEKNKHSTSEARMYAMHSEKYLINAKVANDLREIREEYDILIGTSARAKKNYKILRQPAYPWEITQIQEVEESRIGVVFGREDSGLTNEELRHCDFLITIPLPGEHKVMNITHAVAVILYEIWRTRMHVEEEIKKHRISAHNRRKILFETFENIVKEIEYEEYKKTQVIQSFKKIINRSMPSNEEIDCLIGVLKRIRIAKKESNNTN